MSELELGSVLLHKYRIDALRVASRDVNVYDATDTLHDRHVSIKVFERACRFESEPHEGPVIDMGVVEGGAMFFVESDSPMHRTSSPPPPVPRKRVASAKSEPRARPAPFAPLKLQRASKPPSVPSPPLPKVIVEEDIEVDVELEDDGDDEVTIDCRRDELDIDIPIDFAKPASAKRPWWIVGIAAAALITAGVAWGAQRAPSNAAPTETKTIAPEVTPAPMIEAPPPRPATTIAPPAVADPPPPATTSEHQHHRQPGRDPLTI